MSTDNNSANHRLNGIWERLALGLLSLVLGITLLTIQGMRADQKELEGKVFTLQMDKVSKADLRETENRLLQGFQAQITDLKSQQESSKQDILSRIDLYFKKNL